MNCQEFDSKINDFIYDKIDYLDDVMRFIKHYKECSNCREELNLYYMIHRGLGDVDAPIKDDEVHEPVEELEYLIEYYENYHKKSLYIKYISIFLILTFIVLTVGSIIIYNI